MSESMNSKKAYLPVLQQHRLETSNHSKPRSTSASKRKLLSDINSNDDPKFLFLLVEKYLTSKKANQVITDALNKYAAIMNEKVEEVGRQNAALKSQVQALVSETANLNEMQQIMQLENDTNMQTI